MSLPNIILSRPFVLVTISTSPSGLLQRPTSNSDFRFGYVVQIYETCDSLVVGDTVLFDTKQTTSFFYGSTIYWLVNDNLKYFAEPVPLFAP